MPRNFDISNEPVEPDLPELVLWDEQNPKSLVNLLPEAVAKKLREAAWQHEEYFTMDEQTLYAHFREHKLLPTPTDNRLRLKFWVEYDRAVVGPHGTRMVMANIFSGICSREYFYDRYIIQPSKVAWLICIPANYMTKCLEALEFGIDQLRDILGCSHLLPGGAVDTKVGELKAKIVKMLDERVKGAVVQKAEIRSFSLSLTGSDRTRIGLEGEGISENELERSIRKLEARERQALHLPDAYKSPDIVIETQTLAQEIQELRPGVLTDVIGPNDPRAKYFEERKALTPDDFKNE